MLDALARSVVILGGLIAPYAAGADTLFRVECRDGAFVARWLDEGAAESDPDHFRRATGALNLNCSIYDFDARTDRALSQRVCRDPGGVINAFPPALIIAGETHCQ